MLEEILDYRNITKALEQVTANRGVGGVDGMPTGELRDWLESNWVSWKQSILERPLPTPAGTEGRDTQAAGRADPRHPHGN